MVSKSIGIIGNGFIGSNIYSDLSKLGYSCQFVNKDHNWQELSFDILINANGNSSKLLPENDPLLDFDLTVRNTLKSITEIKYKKYIYLSSCEVYHFKADNRENEIIEPCWISKYGMSKYFAECLVAKHCKDFIILRLATPIGKGMKKGPVYDILYGDKLWISPSSFFQFIPTSYISEFINLTISKEIKSEIFNIGGIAPVNLHEVMSILGREVPYPEKPVVGKVAMINKAHDILPVPYCHETLYNFKDNLTK